MIQTSFRITGYTLLITQVILESSVCPASELRTYQMITSEHRPYIRFGESRSFAARLSGQFDLLLDQHANTASLERFDVKLIDVIELETTIEVPEIEDQSLSHPHNWHFDWTQLEGRITSPEIIEFTGPGPARFATNSAGWPMLDYNLEDFIEHLPGGFTRLRWGYQTALQFQLLGQTIRIDGLDAPLGGADNSEPFIVGAFAQLVPEPPSIVLILLGSITVLISSNRRFNVGHRTCPQGKPTNQR